jgi:hypothetical protein
MSFPGINRGYIDPLEWCRKITDVVNQIMQGRTNNYGEVTLSANAASTTVTLASGRLSTASEIHLTPRSLNASIELAGTAYISSRDVANNQFTITHSNDASTDRTFGYAIIG